MKEPKELKVTKGTKGENVSERKLTNGNSILSLICRKATPGEDELNENKNKRTECRREKKKENSSEKKTIDIGTRK